VLFCSLMLAIGAWPVLRRLRGTASGIAKVSA